MDGFLDFLNDYSCWIVGATLAGFVVGFYVVPFFCRLGAGKALKKGNFKEALTKCSLGLKISPRDFHFWYFRALACRGLGRIDDALNSLLKAGELAPNRLEIFDERADLYLSQGALEDALRDLNWILESDELAFDARLTRSSVLIDLRRYREAEEDCDRLIEKSDDLNCAGAFNNRGVARLGLGRESEAEGDFETAYLLNPRLLVAQAYCAGSWIRRGAPEKTIRLCDTIIKVEPDCSVAFRYRGLAKRARGDESGAVDDLSRAEELERDVFASASRRVEKVF